MTKIDPKTVLFIALILLLWILLLPMKTSFQAIGSEHPITSNDMQIQRQISRKEQSISPSEITSPSSLEAEFINPNYPYYQQAFVNVTFSITVRITAKSYNYTQVNGTIEFDPQLSPGDDPWFVLANESNNLKTKFIGNITMGENKTITWTAMPIRYEALLSNRLVRFNATGLMNGQIPRYFITGPYQIEVQQPIMIVDGPFPAERQGNVDYELKYKKTKQLMLNITSSVNGTYNLTRVEVGVVSNDSHLEVVNPAPEIESLAPGEYYLYNFSIQSTSKKKANVSVVIEVASNVTPAYKLEILVSVLEVPEDEWFGIGIDPATTLMIFLSAFISIAVHRRRKR